MRPRRDEKRPQNGLEMNDASGYAASSAPAPASEMPRSRVRNGSTGNRTPSPSMSTNAVKAANRTARGMSRAAYNARVTERPTPILRGYGGAVAAGHHLAAQVGAAMLADGGNAADAACAMGFALQVLEPHMNGPAGEVPILVHVAREGRSYAISGQGTAPAAATRARFAELGLDLIPGDGLLAATVPAALDAWCTLLARFGTRSLADVLAPARGLASRGFPMYPFLRSVLGFLEKRFREEWPTSAALYLPLRRIGEPQTNPALAAFLGELVDAERAAKGSRETKIRAARDAFYRGRAAEAIEKFLAAPVRDASGRAHAGLLRAADLAGYEGAVEEPVSAEYRGARVWKCGPWSQGPVFLQQLRLLEGFPLADAGQNSADALHWVIECAKLAFADREGSYGDPRRATSRSPSSSPTPTPKSVGRWSTARARRSSCGRVWAGCRRAGRASRDSRRRRRSRRRWPRRAAAATPLSSTPWTAKAISSPRRPRAPGSRPRR